MLSICLLVSGGLGLRILEQIDQSPHRLSAVFTNKQSEPIITYCKNREIPFFSGNPRGGKASDFIHKIECDVLLSVNYLFIIEKDLINLPKKYAINIHGSLLPKYRGRTPHVWAIINGEKEAGVTAHLIDEKVDNGDIVKQIVVPIGEKDTGGEILKKYNDIYPSLTESILSDILNNRITFKAQDKKQATYFGKRTPKDGLINWSWSKERIRNWIRAQANPYPGAYTYYKKIKLVIHKAEFSNLGFRYTDIDGTILEVENDKIYVKTPNGALQLSELETEEKVNLQKGIVLQ